MSNLRRASSFLPILLSLCIAPSSAQKARLTPFRQVILQPVKDNTLYEDPSGGLSNGAGTSIFAGVMAFGEIRRAVLAFDVASNIPPGARILEAKLTLHLTRTISGPKTTSLLPLLADWGEGTSDALGEEGAGAPAASGDATWLHTFYPGSFWLTPGGDYAALASASTSVGFFLGPYTWSSQQMVSDVQAWLDAPATNFGWIVIGDELTAVTTKRFGSREGPRALRPALAITYELPDGACCLTDGTCITTNASACFGRGGSYLGDGTSCTPNPCP